MSLLVPTRRVCRGPRGARCSPCTKAEAEAELLLPALPEEPAQRRLIAGPGSEADDLLNGSDPDAAFPSLELWSGEGGDLMLDGEQLELEAMTEYLAHSFSDDLPRLEDLHFAPLAPPGEAGAALRTHQKIRRGRCGGRAEGGREPIRAVTVSVCRLCRAEDPPLLMTATATTSAHGMSACGVVVKSEQEDDAGR